MSACSAFLLEESSSLSNQVDGVRNREDASSLKSSILAQGVADDNAGSHTPSCPESGQSHLDTAHAKLDHSRLQMLHLSGTLDKRHNRWEALAESDLVHLLNVHAELLGRLEKLLAHSSVLGSLASEGECKLGSCQRDGVVLLALDCLQSLTELSDGCDWESGSVCIMSSASSGCVGKICKIDVGVASNETFHLGQVLLERSKRLSGDCNDLS